MRAHIDFQTSQNQAILKITLYLFRYIRIYTRSLSEDDLIGLFVKNWISEEYIDRENDAKNHIKLGKRLKLIMRNIQKWKKHVWIEELVLDVIFGTGNPAATGIVYSISYSLTELILIMVDRITPIDQQKISIVPDFNQRRWKASISCMIRFHTFFILRQTRQLKKEFARGEKNG